MLLQADAKSLEINVLAFLSQDLILLKEVNDGLDMHLDNQQKFGLPSRLIAKIFVFRLIYGGSAFSYANDPDFAECKYSEKKWQSIIDAFYEKYRGVQKWHSKIMKEVVETGKLVMPTGRQYVFERERGEYPRTKILNFPVQGLGADMMSIARVSLWNRMKKQNIQAKLVNTVHDSIIVDFDEKVCYTSTLVSLVEDVFKDLPANFERLFGVPYNVIMRVENQIGNNWGEMEVFS